MESQTIGSVWSISIGKRAEVIQSIGGKNYRLKKYNIIFGGNSLSPLDPVGFNPLGVMV